jgi:putative nucleotidyltransferase with HDIG domain
MQGNRMETIPKRGSSGFIGKAGEIWDWLVWPSADIVELGQRRRARLLSTFLLILFILFASINLGYLLTRSGYSVPAADWIGYGFLLITYVISRTRWTSVAAVIMVAMFPINIFANLFQGTSIVPSITLGYLVPSFILSGIFFSFGGAVIYAALIFLAELALPLADTTIFPTSRDIYGPLAVNTLCSVLVIIWIRHRDQIEKERENELKEIYDSTLVGWSHALELRDKETEGHSKRVTETTLHLAAAVGMQPADLEHVRRGALLHDIGKMGIPDNILYKTGPLGEEDWQVLYQHPIVAYQLLSPIPYLHQALEIPYCHHERWDGTGYPRRLKGTQIPLAARVFSVVDVWDALLSDRPYRPAWSEPQVIVYLQEQAGKHFDPQIVKVFMQMQYQITQVKKP